MGPGHFGIALAAKTVAPKAPLWVLLAGSELLDLLCFGFAGLGLEELGTTSPDISQGIQVITTGTVPWSHGLFMALVWSFLAAGGALWVFRSRRAGWALGLVVFSHWTLDWLVHPPDLPLLLNGSPLLGLGLWLTRPGLILSGILEVGLIAAGLAIYLAYRSKSRHPVEKLPLSDAAWTRKQHTR